MNSDETLKCRLSDSWRPSLESHVKEMGEEESDYEEPRNMHETTQQTQVPVERNERDDNIKALLTSSPVNSQSWKPNVHDVCIEYLKCGDLINSQDRMNVMCSGDDYQLVENVPPCRYHSSFLSPSDTVEGIESVLGTRQENGEVSIGLTPQSSELEKESGQQRSISCSDDVLPPTGLAKRLVERWSNIETLKSSQIFTNALQSDAPHYAPNTAKTIAARFSAGIKDDSELQRNKTSMEPKEQWPSQGLTRGLIAKFSAMHA